MTSRPARIFFPLIIVLGLLLRIAYLNEIHHRPDFTGRLGIDPTYYDYWARAIVSGDWAVQPPVTDPEIPDHPFFKPPGYPYLLALVYLLSSGSYLAPRLVQMALGLLAAVLAYTVGRRYIGERAALIWSFLMATYWIFIYYEGELLESAPVNLLVLSFFFLLLRWSGSPRPGSAALGGLALGLVALMRPNFLAFPAAVLPWQYWVLRRENLGRRFPASAGAFLLAILIPIVPVTIRNYAVSKEFVPSVTYGGINLYLGNQEVFEPVLTHASTITGDWSSFDYPQIVRRLEREEGRALTHWQASGILARRAGIGIKNNPGRFLRSLVSKTLLFWGPREVSNNKEVEYERLSSRLLTALPGSFSLVLALAISGTILWGFSLKKEEDTFSPRRRALGLVLALTAVYFLSFLPFITAALYRVPVIPLLLLAGAAGTDSFIQLIRRRAWKAVTLAAVAFAVLCLLARLNPTGYRPNLLRWYYDQAIVLAESGLGEEALVLCNEALEASPDHPYLLKGRGNLYRDRGDLPAAIADWERSIENIQPPVAINPGPIYAQLGDAYFKLGLEEKAEEKFTAARKHDPENPIVLNHSGVFYSQRGFIDKARGFFLRAVALRPDYAAPHTNLGLIDLQEGESDRALARFKTALAADPCHRDARYNLAAVYVERGDNRAAERHYRKVIELEPDFAPAHYYLALLLAEEGRYREAVTHYGEVLRIDSAEPLARLGIEEAVELGGRDLDLLRAACATVPDSALVRSRLAAALFDADFYPEAECEYRAAIRLDPDRVEAHIGLGILLGMSRRVFEAEKALRRAAELDPDSPEARFNLCVLYRQLGRQEEFNQEYTILQKLSPRLAAKLIE